MPYWILIFNQLPLRHISESSLLAAIKESNFDTLCRQYGLDAAMIGAALEYLSVELDPRGKAPFFLLGYQRQPQPPIVVTMWTAASEMGDRLLAEVTSVKASDNVREYLRQTRFIYGVELTQTQLTDMGLLLAYELARWVAGQGEGIVLGLDGVWYQLNPYKAFVPLE